MKFVFEVCFQTLFSNFVFEHLYSNWLCSGNITVTMNCNHYEHRKQTKSPVSFKDGKLQATNTIVQREHSKRSVKGTSRSAHNVLASHDTKGATKPAAGRKLNQINRVSSTKPALKEDCCKFGFTVTYFADQQKWYIMRPRAGQNSEDTLCHTGRNHLPVEKDHIKAHKTDLKETTLERVRELIDSGVTCSGIVQQIRKESGRAVSLSTVQNMKTNEIDSLFEEVSKIPHGKAADRLIALFQSLSNTSYVYVKHNMKSGFVHYQKPRSNKKEMTVVLAETILQKYIEDVKAQRNSLRLKDSNDMLVAFAWCHDDEMRKANKFPEYIACDTTFGVNKQQRALLVFALTDGYHNKASTCFRCFMPSKQKAAYVWPIAYAFPYLVGSTVTKRVRCFATDNEQTLNDGVKEAGTTQNYLNLKHRLDYYHHFVQKWEDNCTPLAKCPLEVKKILRRLRLWITSWYYDLESESEYKHSKACFDKYLSSKKQLLGATYTKGVEACVSRFTTNIDSVGCWNFKHITTLGFYGSTIVEASNVGIKKGHRGVRSSMSIEVSAHQQHKQVEYKSLKQNVDMATDMNRDVLWSRSLTASYLTKYMEGISIKNFDTRDRFCAVYVGGHRWLVIHISLLMEMGSDVNRADSVAAVVSLKRMESIQNTTD